MTMSLFDVLGYMYLDSTPDPTLTVENVNKVMRNVRNWRKVGSKIGVPQLKMDEILNSHSTGEERREAFASYCVYTLHHVSWEVIARVIYWSEEGRALEQLKSYMRTPPGVCVHINCLYFMRFSVCVCLSVTHVMPPICEH